MRKPLLCDQHGSTYVEYLLAVGVIALVALGGARRFGATIGARAQHHAECAATLDCAPGHAEIATATSGSADAEGGVSSGSAASDATESESYRGVPIAGDAAARSRKKAELDEQAGHIGEMADKLVAAYVKEYPGYDPNTAYYTILEYQIIPARGGDLPADTEKINELSVSPDTIRSAQEQLKQTLGFLPRPPELAALDHYFQAAADIVGGRSRAGETARILGYDALKETVMALPGDVRIMAAYEIDHHGLLKRWMGEGSFVNANTSRPSWRSMKAAFAGMAAGKRALEKQKSP